MDIVWKFTAWFSGSLVIGVFLIDSIQNTFTKALIFSLVIAVLAVRGR